MTFLKIYFKRAFDWACFIIAMTIFLIILSLIDARDKSVCQSNKSLVLDSYMTFELACILGSSLPLMGPMAHMKCRCTVFLAELRSVHSTNWRFFLHGIRHRTHQLALRFSRALRETRRKALLMRSLIQPISECFACPDRTSIRRDRRPPDASRPPSPAAKKNLTSSTILSLSLSFSHGSFKWACFVRN